MRKVAVVRRKVETQIGVLFLAYSRYNVNEIIKVLVHINFVIYKKRGMLYDTGQKNFTGG